MMRLILLMLLLHLGAVVNAAPVQVRGGEHGRFTRLVLDLPEQRDYEILKDDEITLTVRGPMEGFGLEQWYQRLTANRIAAITQTAPNSLKIKLGCECLIRSFFAASSMLVIDVFEDLNDDTSSLRPMLRTDRDLSSETSNVKLPLAADVKRVAAWQVTEVSQFTPEMVSSGRGLRQELAVQLARGVGQMLLQPRMSAQRENEFGSRNSSATPEEGMPVDFSRGSPAENMRVVTSVDHAFETQAHGEETFSSIADCMKEVDLDISSWTKSEDFDSEIGAQRTQLYDAQGKLDVAAVGDLARVYIAFGLGEEAQDVLGLSDGPSDLLMAMAGVLQGNGLISDQPASWHGNCDGPAALWALASGPLQEPKDLNTDAVLREFSSLPRALRRELAPKLIDALLQHGLKNVAGDLSRLAKRGREELSSGELFANGSLEREFDREGAAAEQFQALAIRNVPETPSALLSLIDMKIKAGEGISNTDLSLLDAFLKEYESETLESELLGAKLRTLLAMGAYLPAFETLRKLEKLGGAHAVKSPANFFLKSLSQVADDGEFVLVVFDEALQEIDFSMEARSYVAARLSELGFADFSKAFLTSRANVTTQSLPGQYGNSAGKNPSNVEPEKADKAEDDRSAAVTPGKAKQPAPRSDNPDEPMEYALQGADLQAFGPYGAAEWHSELDLKQENTGDGAEGSMKAANSVLSESRQLRELVNSVLSTHRME